VCEEERLPCLPYFALARGFLTGKYRPRRPQIESPRATGVLESYFKRARSSRCSTRSRFSPRSSARRSRPSGWPGLRAQPTVPRPGRERPLNPGQLAEQLPAVEIEPLPPAQLERLGEASAVPQRAA